ncbi:hypothetical protein C0992_012670, partial [Termitomyces sp. T32_za158]
IPLKLWSPTPTNLQTPTPCSTTLPSLTTKRPSRPTVSAVRTGPGSTYPSTSKNADEKTAPVSCAENGGTSSGNARNAPPWAAPSGPLRARNVSTGSRRTTPQI